MASQEMGQGIKQRDKAVCERFVEAHYRSLYRWFLWLTNSSQDAADLTQDTFVALWQSLDRFKSGMPLKPWLYGIARNVWRKRCARHSEEPTDLEEVFEAMPDPHPSPEQVMLNKEASRILEEAVANLPHNYREAVTLRFWEDMDYKDMARMLSISEDLARWRVHQGRKLLHEKLLYAGIIDDQLARSGGKLGWWMRIQDRPGPVSALLTLCLTTIPLIMEPGDIAALAQISTDEIIREHGEPSPEMATNKHALQAIRVGTLDEIRNLGHIVVSMDRPVVVFYHNGKVFALDNRCPHMGFPLNRGSVHDGVLTCYWHHARFDLASGCAFDLYADDVPAYPVEIRNGEVWLLPRRPTDNKPHWQRRLKEGIEQNIPLVTAKAVIALMHHDTDIRAIVRQGALFGACYQDSWGDGLTILTAMATLLPHLQGEDRMLALWHGLVRVGRNVYGQSPRWERQPLSIDDAPTETLRRWFRRWTVARHRDGAERCLLTAIINGAPPTDVADLLFSAATDRIFSDGGHTVDFINKAFEMLDIAGWEHASEVLPTLLRGLVRAQGGEESSEWRQPVDLAAMLLEVSQELPGWLEEGKRHRVNENDCNTISLANDIRLQGLVDTLLGNDPADIIAILAEAIRSGVSPVELGRVVAYAAGMRICRFGTGNESGDWVTVLHTFSYCNAAHQAVKRAQSPEVIRALFHGAIKIYLDYFLNIPPAPLPGERVGLDSEPNDADELLARFLETLDRQGQVNEAGRIAARYLSLHYPVEPLIRTLTRAVVREDAEFHTYQMIEAAVRQCREWRGEPQGNDMLIAAARYIAAWSPTRRTLLQTANIALRLRRGEAIYMQAELQ